MCVDFLFDNKPSQTYIGLTENSFKTRFTNHRNSFKDHKKKLSTELSKHVWKLKEANVHFQISWKILKHTASYNPVSERCNLCLWEKYFIICRPELATLNRRNELVSSCRQREEVSPQQPHMLIYFCASLLIQI